MDLPTFDIQTPGKMSMSGILKFVILFILLCFVPNVIIFCFDNGYANKWLWLETKGIKFEARNQNNGFTTCIPQNL